MNVSAKHHEKPFMMEFLFLIYAQQRFGPRGLRS